LLSADILTLRLQTNFVEQTLWNQSGNESVSVINHADQVLLWSGFPAAPSNDG
jgi:hypothetical protein